MARKPAYAGLEQRIKELEKENAELKHDCAVLKQVLNSAVPFCIIDKDNNVLEVNNTFCSYFGFNKKEVLGRKCYNIWRNKVCNTPDCPLAAILSGDTRSECEMECELSDGTKVFCIVTAIPYRSPEGELIGVTESFVDITDRKTAEAAIQESDEHLRNVLQNIPVMMIAFDEDGKIVVWNKECERITGFRANEIIDNSSALELLYPDEQYRRLIIDKLSHPVNDYNNWEFDIFCKDGSSKTVSWSNISVSFPVAGCFSWVVGVDVTERTQIEKALRKRERELVSKTSELEQINTALQVMLEKRESDKAELESKVLHNYNRMIKPVLEKLLSTGLNRKQETYVKTVMNNLESITSPFAKELSSQHHNLSSTEIMVASYIREGKATKEIATLMHLSKRTIDAHRANIRKKLGLTAKDSNLSSFLSTLS